MENGHIITWMLHQIIRCSNKEKLVDGKNNDIQHLPPLPHPLPTN